MKLRILLFALVMVCVGAFWVIGVSSQEAEQSKAMDGKKSPEAMMAELGQPGEGHEWLESMVGTWKMAGKSWMTPAMEPAPWGGVAEKEMILGGRFLREEVHSEVMGQSFTGISIVGYDNIQGKYLWHWIDDMSTGMMMSEGTCDKSGQTLTMIGEYMDPMTKTMQGMKTIVNIVDEDNHVFEMYMKGPDGAEFKSMEIVYERGK